MCSARQSVHLVCAIVKGNHSVLRRRGALIVSSTAKHGERCLLKLASRNSKEVNNEEVEWFHNSGRKPERSQYLLKKMRKT